MSDIRLPLGKTCTKCGEWKLYEQFYRDRAMGDGRRTWCKTCAYRAKEQWNREHPEKWRAQQQRSYANHREKRLAETKAWYRRLRAEGWQRAKSPGEMERNRIRQRQWYAANKEEALRYQKEYARLNADVLRPQRAVYRSKRRAVLGTLTVEEWQMLCEVHRNRCLCCGAVAPLTVDHIVPVSLAGRGDLSNVQPLCKPCNSRKGARIQDFRRMLSCAD